MGLKGLTHLFTPLQIHVNTGINYGIYTSSTPSVFVAVLVCLCFFFNKKKLFVIAYFE